MKYFSIFLILFFAPLYGQDPLQIKASIAQKQGALTLATAEEERAQLYYELALDYFYDQENDLAFVNFLKALEAAPKKEVLQLDEEEKKLYHQALEEYLCRQKSDPLQLARDMLENYGKAAQENPQFLHLNFLMATAYANLGEFQNFFERFFQGYPYLHDSFLAYKTQGILYLRLSHHGKLEAERAAFQRKAFYYLTEALARNPQDPGLYKVLIFLAKDEKKGELIVSYLEKMLKCNVEFQRTDTLLYVREAVLLGEYAMGQAIIDRARSLYDYSRAISAAQDYLDTHKPNQQR